MQRASLSGTDLVTLPLQARHKLLPDSYPQRTTVLSHWQRSNKPCHSQGTGEDPLWQREV